MPKLSPAIGPSWGPREYREQDSKQIFTLDQDTTMPTTGVKLFQGKKLSSWLQCTSNVEVELCKLLLITDYSVWMFSSALSENTIGG